MLGSRHYVQHPLRPLQGVVANVNLEMLGRPRPDEPGLAWITGMERSDLGQWLTDANPEGRVRFVDAASIGPDEGSAFDRSDNYPLAQRGVVAHSISTGRIDAYYHSPDDEADGLDYEAMAELVRGIARGVYRLAEHEGRPRWIEDEQVGRSP